MENSLVQQNKKSATGSTLLGRLKRLFQPGPKSVKRGTGFGRTVGIVWEFKSDFTKEPIACIVQVERSADSARVTIYDSNDPKGTSVTNVIENIASGVYLEHLAHDYRPDQIQVFHRDTVPIDVEPRWGTKPVALSWSPTRRCFEDPSWGQWKPDFEIDPLDKIFIRELRCKAAVEIETWMRERHERGAASPRECELYDRYQEHISAKSENHRYNLRGGWIFTPPNSYV